MTNPDQFTFFGGGHRGTETEFGQNAERFGIREVNYSFEGHQPERTQGQIVLSSEELNRGDISMEIVSLRMHRTGWAVELGKLFNRPLSVYDQERNQWYSWKENAWVEDLPKIEHPTFVGTGTRNLTDSGRDAIRDLFTRSFSA